VIYREALRRIEALMGCTEGSLEEAQLIHWATIADNWEWATGIDNTAIRRKSADRLNTFNAYAASHETPPPAVCFPRRRTIYGPWRATWTPGRILRAACETNGERAKLSQGLTGQVGAKAHLC
jgi:hypothetical protein